MLPRISFPQAGHLFLLLSLLLFSTGCETTKPPPDSAWGHLAHRRYGAAAVTDGSVIYVLGGSDATYRPVPAERIDLRTGQAEVLPWKLIRRRYAAAVLTDGQIWIFGGEDGGSRIPPVERIDLATGTVTEVGQVQVPRVGTDALLLDDTIVLIGGLGPNELQDGRGAKMELFTPATTSSALGPDLPVSIQTSIALLRGQLHTVGGWKPDGAALADHYVFNGHDAWSRLPDLPWPTSSNTVVSAGRYLYSFGDYTEQGRVARWNARHGRWDRIETTYSPRRHATSVVVDGTVYVIGGNRASRNSALDLIEAFKLSDLARARAKTAP